MQLGLLFGIFIFLSSFFGLVKQARAADVYINCDGNQAAPKVISEFTDWSPGDALYLEQAPATDGWCQINSTASLSSFSMTSGVTLTSEGYPSNVGVEIVATGNITVGAGSIIQTNIKGCPGEDLGGGTTYGTGPSTMNICEPPPAEGGVGQGVGEDGTLTSGGGAYGGGGGDANDNGTVRNGGSSYGDTTITTIYQGASGASAFDALEPPSTLLGGTGGGSVNLLGATVTVNGSIYASGTDGNVAGSQYSGGGSGGSIKIVSTTLLGTTGRLYANGGDAGGVSPTIYAGGGAGGRIFLQYQGTRQDVIYSYVHGGNYMQENGAGGVGTIYRLNTDIGIPEDVGGPLGQDEGGGEDDGAIPQFGTWGIISASLFGLGAYWFIRKREKRRSLAVVNNDIDNLSFS